MFNKLRVKVSQNETYLNTPKQEEECVITSAEPFTEPLPNVEEQSSTKEIVGSVIGVYGINKYKTCRLCLKKVIIKENLLLCSLQAISEDNTCENAQVVTSLQQTCSNAVPPTRHQDVFALLVPAC